MGLLYLLYWFIYCYTYFFVLDLYLVESSWNVMAHGDPREGKWRGNWRMEWVASTLHTTSEHGVSSITTADAHTSAASSRLNWRPSAGLNGLVRFAERRNLVSARVPSHFNWPLSCLCLCTVNLALCHAPVGLLASKLDAQDKVQSHMIFVSASLPLSTL
jgi:hypothetical protein